MLALFEQCDDMLSETICKTGHTIEENYNLAFLTVEVSFELSQTPVIQYGSWTTVQALEVQKNEADELFQISFLTAIATLIAVLEVTQVQ